MNIEFQKTSFKIQHSTTYGTLKKMLGITPDYIYELVRFVQRFFLAKMYLQIYLINDDLVLESINFLTRSNLN